MKPKQKLIDGILYFQELEPQYIDTDAAVVYVQKELVNEFKKLNKRRLFDIEPFNYKVFTSKKPFWYVDEEEEQEDESESSELLDLANLLCEKYWEGSIEGYEQYDAWRNKFKDKEIRTVWRFNTPYYTTSTAIKGTGYEIDYDINDTNNYEYVLFHWVIMSGGRIYMYIGYFSEKYYGNLIYGDYTTITNDTFVGQIQYGDNFNFVNNPNFDSSIFTYNVIPTYSFVSYDSTYTTYYGYGKVQITQDIVGSKIKIQVIENSVEGFVGNYYWVDLNYVSVDSEKPNNCPLYLNSDDTEGIGISVRIYTEDNIPSWAIPS